MIANFTANTTQVSHNTPVYLTWGVSGLVDYCEASGGWSGQKGTSGVNVATHNLTSSTSFTLRCYGPGGWSSPQTVTVGVNSPAAPVIATNIQRAITSFVPVLASVSRELPINLVCNPSSCSGYYGTLQGTRGSLDLVVAPTTSTRKRCVIQIDQEVPIEVACGNVPASLWVANRSVGSHVAQLTMFDEGGSVTKRTIRFTIKESIRPKLVCSLDGIEWISCGDIQSQAGVGIYVKDASSPSTGAKITSRRIEAFPGMKPGIVAGEVALFKPSSVGSKVLKLAVKDSAGKSGDALVLLHVGQGGLGVCEPEATLVQNAVEQKTIVEKRSPLNLLGLLFYSLF